MYDWLATCWPCSYVDLSLIPCGGKYDPVIVPACSSSDFLNFSYRQWFSTDFQEEPQ